MNKSEIVRSIIAEQPDMKPQQLVETLAARKIKMSREMASNYASKARKDLGKQSRVMRATVKPNGPVRTLTVTDVEAVRVLVERLGRETVEQLARQFG